MLRFDISIFPVKNFLSCHFSYHNRDNWEAGLLSSIDSEDVPECKKKKKTTTMK